MEISKNGKYAIIGAVVIVGGYFAYQWYQNSLVVAPVVVSPSVTPTVSTPATPAFNPQTFLQGNWTLAYSSPTSTGGTEQATIATSAAGVTTYTVVGSNPLVVYQITNIAYDAPSNTLSFTKVNSNGVAFPTDSLLVNQTANTLTGTEGGWNVVYTKSK